MNDTQFIGRPQASCPQCRARHIKCGKERPSCKECRENSIECTGYRPRFCLDFKDESQLAEKKVQARKRKQAEEDKAARFWSHSKLCKVTANRLLLDWQSSDLTAFSNHHHRHLHIPILDVALSCFITNCLQGTFLSELHPLYKDIQPASPLYSSLYAPALASLAIDSGQPKVMTLAHSQYARAVRRTNLALSNSKEYITDDTLASVLHLGLFELISFQEETVKTNGTAHLLGALELVKLRGHEQLETHIGRELYIAVVVGIRVRCAKTQSKLPQEIIDLDSRASKLLDAHPTYDLRHVFDTFADIQLKKTMSIPISSDIMDKCFQLDEAIRAVCASELIVSPLGLESADKQYITATKKVNTLRILRLFLNCWIQMFISANGSAVRITGSEDAQLYRSAYESMKIIATEIIDSAEKLITPYVTLNSRYLIFYLYTIVEEPPMPAYLKARARNIIRSIGVEGNIPEALQATKRLNKVF